MTRFSAAAAAALLALGAAFGPAAPAAAAPVSYDVSGTFGSSFLAGSLSAGSYPYPDLIGGGFAGAFTVDDAAPRAVGSSSFSQFDFVAVDLYILDIYGSVLHHIDSGPNRIHVTDGQAQLRFGESGGTAATGVPEDLRLTFTDPGFVGADTLFNVAALSGATFVSGFSETDNAGGGYWDLEVASVSVEQFAEATVPEPGALAIFGLGLAALGVARRRKAA